MAVAERRWERIHAIRPDLAPALDLQRRLLGIVIETTRAIERGRLPRLSLPPRYLAAKLDRGVPMLAGEPIPVPIGVLKTTLLRLCEALSMGGAGKAASHIAEAIESGTIDAASLLTSSLARDQAAIQSGAVHHGLAPDLTWLVAELAAQPFVYALQRALLATSGETLFAARDRWKAGYCPACGSWPALAEVAGGHRLLRCSFCALGWELTEYCCIYCGDRGESFVTAAPDQERKDRRLELCASCGSYLKTVDVEALSPFPLVAIADMETMDLDVAAMEHGYGRPPLRDFKPSR
jgi:FdhE protein